MTTITSIEARSGSAALRSSRLARLPATESPDSLLDEFAQVRAATAWVCAGLEVEDHVVQPAGFVSPPKWHLAHTTWFFDRFVLQPGSEKRSHSIPDCNLLFNSYYKSEGQHWLQGNRGQLSRPLVREVLEYRDEITARITDVLRAGTLSDKLLGVLELGIHHEKQHQELLLMDIKFIFASHPHPVSFDTISVPPQALAAKEKLHWLEFPEKLAEFGADNAHFAWDNEKPRHRRLLHGFKLASRMVSNAEYLAFIRDGGYQRPELWLSDGWDWLNQHGITNPLYWHSPQTTEATMPTAATFDFDEYHLGGKRALHPQMPVSHVSYFEADAFARWSGARLPTEFELEYFMGRIAQPGGRQTAAFWKPDFAVCPLPDRAADDFDNGLLWQWTQSPYTAYPGFVPETGALAEYNGKFMSGQMVLRGGCVATPRRHMRDTYRNFYRPADRWCFSGIRLAEDL